MKTFEIITPIIEAQTAELSAEEQSLIAAAREAYTRSYAPYSKFHVGAAILLDNGEVVTGSNQENAAYPSGTCAERTAAYYAHAAHPDARFRAIAIAARGTDGEEVSDPVAPCGACRQALLEFEKLAEDDVKVILVGRDKNFILPSVRATLPLAFSEF